MPSPYLDKPLLPLTIVLPQLLAKVEVELANEKLESAEQERLRRRAKLIRALLQW